MPSPPPAWLVEWTEYAVLVVGGIASILTLLKGKTLLDLRVRELRNAQARFHSGGTSPPL